MELEQQRKNPLELNYWGVRGAAQPVRHLLEYLHLDYVQKKCQCPKQWFTRDIQIIKKQCVFVSLPYINDNGFIVSEIVPIVKYLCKKANRRDLLGKTIEHEVKIQELLVKFIRHRNKTSQLWSRNASNASESAMKQKVETVFKSLTKQPYLMPILELIQKRGWIFGYLTIADFFIFQTCFYLTGIFPDKVKLYPFVEEFKKKFQSIEEIKNYYNSDRAILKIFIIPNIEHVWKGDPKYM